MITMSVRNVLPFSQEDLEEMGRRRYQCPSVLKTAGKRPQWYIRYVVDVITGPGQTGRHETTKYLGDCKNIGKREAERLRDAFMCTVNRPDVVLPSQVQFSLVLRAYRDAFMPGLKPNSKSTYENAIAHHIEPVFGAQRLCDIRKESVQAWIHSKSDLSLSRRRTLLSVIASVWDRATDWDYTQSRNPAKGIKLADDGGGRRRDTRALTVDEVRRLLALTDLKPEWREMGQIIRLGIFCGLRIGEILALRWRDVQSGSLRVERAQAQNGIIHAPKSFAGRRTVPLPASVGLVRPAGTGDDDLIFRVGYSTTTGRLNRLADQIGLNFYGFGCHTFRHTYATLMEQAGDRNLKASLGHSTDAMSAAYVSRTFADTQAKQDTIAAFVIGEAYGKQQ